MNEQRASHRQPRADGVRGTRHVFVRELAVKALIGVHDYEKDEPQKLVISVDLTVLEEPAGHDDKIENVVCYGEIADRVQSICSRGHINLIETLAERIAQACLEDRRVQAARVRVEKPDALADCASVGVEIERLQALT